MFPVSLYQRSERTEKERFPVAVLSQKNVYSGRKFIISVFKEADTSPLERLEDKGLLYVAEE